MKFPTLLILSTALIMNSPQIHAAPSAQESIRHPALLPQAQEWLYQSKTNGKTYRIQTIAVGKQPASGYPVLYLLDGDAYFPMAAAVAQGLEMRAQENHATPLLIVAVGYPGGKIFDNASRAEDYTPPSTSYAQTGDGTNKKFGGAEAFWRFLHTELQPQIAREFGGNPKKQTLFGHSYGGLFGLYVLFNHTETFQNYLIASPSFWLNQQRILQDLPTFLAKQQQAQSPVNVRLSVGEYEQTLAPHLSGARERQSILQNRRMVDHLLQTGKQFAALPTKAMRVETVVYPKETHSASAFSALADGIKQIFVYNADLKPTSKKAE